MAVLFINQIGLSIRSGLAINSVEGHLYSAPSKGMSGAALVAIPLSVVWPLSCVWLGWWYRRMEYYAEEHTTQSSSRPPLSGHDG